MSESSLEQLQREYSGLPELRKAIWALTPRQISLDFRGKFTALLELLRAQTHDNAQLSNTRARLENKLRAVRRKNPRRPLPKISEFHPLGGEDTATVWREPALKLIEHMESDLLAEEGIIGQGDVFLALEELLSTLLTRTRLLLSFRRMIHARQKTLEAWQNIVKDEW